MGARVMERRQYRRIDLEVPVEVHSLDPEDAPVGILTGRARNVSLAGCYAIMRAPFALPSGTNVSCTVSVPQESTKQFPFVRLIAKGWVVRLEPVSDPAEVGVAIAFTSDVTALTTIGAS